MGQQGYVYVFFLSQYIKLISIKIYKLQNRKGSDHFLGSLLSGTLLFLDSYN